MKLTVLTAAEGAGWESDLLAGLPRGETNLEVSRRCVDVVDLLSAAAAGLGRAVLLDAQLRRFDASCHERLVALGVAVIGVVEPTASAAEQDRLRCIGVEFFVPADAPLVVMAAVIQAGIDGIGTAATGRRSYAVPGLDLPTAGGPDARQFGFGEPGEAVVDQSAQSSPEVAAAAGAVVGPSHRALPAAEPHLGQDFGADRLTPTQLGSVIAVWGPTGAPGRSTVALTLADEIARLQRDCLLIDADVYGGVLAPMLGLLDESPGLAAACRQAQSHRLEQASLTALTWQVNDRLAVLTGITRADRWPEIRPNALGQLLSLARQRMAFTVLDLGFSLETDEELSFDTLAPRRNGVTLTALDEADLVLAVGSADPIGIQRLIRGLDELRAAGIAAPVWIVLNQVRRGPVAGEPQRELLSTLERFAGQSAAALLPYDRAALDSALASGRTVGDVCPGSPFRAAMTELAAGVVGVPAPRRQRRR